MKDILADGGITDRLTTGTTMAQFTVDPRVATDLQLVTICAIAHEYTHRLHIWYLSILVLLDRLT